MTEAQEELPGGPQGRVGGTGFGRGAGCGSRESAQCLLEQLGAEGSEEGTQGSGLWADPPLASAVTAETSRLFPPLPHTPWEWLLKLPVKLTPCNLATSPPSLRHGRPLQASPARP